MQACDGPPEDRRTPTGGETEAISAAERMVFQLGQKLAAARRRPRFDSVDHLGPDAVVSFVDDELTPGALHRARVHLVHCPECRREVRAQRRTADVVHESNGDSEVTIPAALLARLAGFAESGCGEGPSAADTPTPQPEGLIDRVETLIRAVRRRR